MATPCYQKIIYGPTADIEPLNRDLNVELPASTKNRLLSKVVYADDEVTPMWVEHTLNVECIIYNEIITSSNATSDVEREADRIRTILSTKGLRLKIYPVGLGELGVINGIGVGAVPDVKGGPYPQDVEVMPYASNNAISIRWTVMFRTTDCVNYTNLDLLQYNIEQDFEVDDDGNMQFTVHINYQTRNPILDAQPLQNLNQMLVKRVSRSFQGMRKKTRTGFSRDMRIMSVRIVYSEIQSDNAFFPYTSDISVVDDLESTLYTMGGASGTSGFQKWKRTISGSIRLPPRIYKGYAWYVLAKILQTRFANLRLSLKIPAMDIVARPLGQPEDEEVKQTGWFLPLRIKITEPIYSREIKFNLEYLVCNDLKNILQATNMFERVNTLWEEAPILSDPQPVSNQWKNWQDSRDHNSMGLFRYNLTGIPIVFSQCNNTKTVPEFGSNAVVRGEDDYAFDTSSTSSTLGEEETAENVAYPDGEELSSNYNWVVYENDFEHTERTNNVLVNFLEQPGDNYYAHDSAQGAYVNREAEGMVINGRITNQAQNFPPTVFNRGASQHLIRMKGHAIRVGSKIPIPFIISIGNRLAIRVGDPRSSQKQIATGDVPVYLAMWDITYAAIGGDIYSEDLLNSIVSTGSPAHYT